jgi:hypothetical protein
MDMLRTFQAFVCQARQEVFFCSQTHDNTRLRFSSRCLTQAT